MMFVCEECGAMKFSPVLPNGWEEIELLDGRICLPLCPDCLDKAAEFWTPLPAVPVS